MNCAASFCLGPTKQIFQHQLDTVPRASGRLLRQRPPGSDLLLARGMLLRRLEGERGRRPPRVRRRLGEGGGCRRDPGGGGKFEPALERHFRLGDVSHRQEEAGRSSGAAIRMIEKRHKTPKLRISADFESLI